MSVKHYLPNQHLGLFKMGMEESQCFWLSNLCLHITKCPENGSEQQAWSKHLSLSCSCWSNFKAQHPTLLQVPSPLNPSTAAHQPSQPLCSFWLHRDKKTTAVFSRGWLECCTSALNSLFENGPQIPLESCWITESGNTLDWWYKCSQRQFFSAQLI